MTAALSRYSLSLIGHILERQARMQRDERMQDVLARPSQVSAKRHITQASFKGRLKPQLNHQYCEVCCLIAWKETQSYKTQSNSIEDIVKVGNHQGRRSSRSEIVTVRNRQGQQSSRSAIVKVSNRQGRRSSRSDLVKVGSRQGRNSCPSPTSS
jgi:hypothetical protein